MSLKIILLQLCGCLVRLYKRYSCFLLFEFEIIPLVPLCGWRLILTAPEPCQRSSKLLLMNSGNKNQLMWALSFHYPTSCENRHFPSNPPGLQMLKMQGSFPLCSLFSPRHSGPGIFLFSLLSMVIRLWLPPQTDPVSSQNSQEKGRENMRACFKTPWRSEVEAWMWHLMGWEWVELRSERLYTREAQSTQDSIQDLYP